MRWTPTAERLPESGVPVLLYVRGVIVTGMHAGRLDLHCDSYGYIEDYEYDDEDERYWPEGWYQRVEPSDPDYGWMMLDTSDQVTHWMPLPDTP